MPFLSWASTVPYIKLLIQAATTSANKAKTIHGLRLPRLRELARVPGEGLEPGSRKPAGCRAFCMASGCASRKAFGADRPVARSLAGPVASGSAHSHGHGRWSPEQGAALRRCVPHAWPSLQARPTAQPATSPFRVVIPKRDSPRDDARAHWRHGHDPAITRRLDQPRAVALHRLADPKLGSSPCQAFRPNDSRLARHDCGRLVARRHHEPLLASRPRPPAWCRRQADVARGMTQRASSVLP